MNKGLLNLALYDLNEGLKRAQSAVDALTKIMNEEEPEKPKTSPDANTVAITSRKPQ